MVADFATVFVANFADVDMTMFGDIRVFVVTTAEDDDFDVVVDVCFNTLIVEFMALFTMTAQLYSSLFRSVLHNTPKRRRRKRRG